MRNHLLLLTRIHPLESEFRILKYIKPELNYCAIDVGSNDGSSILSIRKYSKKSQIVAFDPIEKPKIRLRKSEKYIQIGLGENFASSEIHIPTYKGIKLTQYSSSSIESAKKQLSKDAGIDTNSIKTELQKVDLRTLDSYSLEPFFLKVDVEGFELQVLQGATKTINQFRPLLLIEIQSQQAFSEIYLLLASFDYKSYCIKTNIRRLAEVFDWQPSSRNYLFIPRGGSPVWAWKSDLVKKSTS